MSGFLLDTNVVSELTRSVPDSQVMAFLAEQDDLWLSAMAVHELEFGLQLLLTGNVATYCTRCCQGLSRITRTASCLWTEGAQSGRPTFVHRRVDPGRVLDLGDALVAGTARAHDLSVATRNVADFNGLDVDVTNPWEPQ